MTSKTRKIFFWILVFLFFAAASLTIPYSMGYRFNFERGIFIYTGSVTIKSNPQEVDIKIDGILVENKSVDRLNNSYHIGGLKPGEHMIEVSAPGFNTWNKKVAINSGISTEFWNVILTRTEYQRDSIETPGINDFFYSQSRKSVVYVWQDEGEFKINFLNLESKKNEVIFSSEDYQFTSDSKENIEWSPNDLEIIVPVEKSGIKDYLVIDLETKEIKSLQKMTLSQEIRNVRWDDGDQGYIFYIAQNNLHRINSLKIEEKNLIAENIISYDVSENKVFYLEKSSGLVYSESDDGSSEPKRITHSNVLTEEGNPIRITVYDEERIAFLAKSGELQVYNGLGEEPDIRKIATNISEIQFSNDGKKMLFWNDWEISVYFLRPWEVQPIRLRNERKDVARFSEVIRNVQWSKEYEHVIASVGKTIKLIELDHRDSKNIMDIASLQLGETKLTSDFPNDQLLFIDKTGERESLNIINFPEKEGIF